MDNYCELALTNSAHAATKADIVEIDGVPIFCVKRVAMQPEFDGRLPVFRHSVLVRIDAFSCNYRDKALMLQFSEQFNRLPMSKKSIGFGSEFSGTVISVGCDVSTVQPGDRVMPDASYPGMKVSSVRPGIVTNSASQRWAIFDESKLCVVPAWMSTIQAASYSLAAQTAFSMVRKSGLGRNSIALVASARSSTSLAIIRVLKAFGAKVIAVSSTPWGDGQIRSFGDLAGIDFVTLKEVVHQLSDNSCDAIFDPFVDINFGTLAPKLRMGGSYLTCGFKNQHEANFEKTDNLANFYQVATSLIINNQQLIGNCIGTAQDLKDVLSLGELVSVPTDSVFTLDQPTEFLYRTFNRQKFGKVVLDYGMTDGSVAG